MIHGDIRKKVTVQVAGDAVEVEEYVDEEDNDTYKGEPEALANRQSFIIMRDRMKAKGIETRASMDLLGTHMAAGPSLDPGRVVLAITDIFLVDLITAEFNQLPTSIELVPALGSENTLLIVNQAIEMGGLDFVLMHPDFLKDTSSVGLVARLRAMHVKVCGLPP